MSVILVVEHEAPVRSLLLRALETAGYAVLAAKRPSEALHILGNNLQVDLLITSVLLPEMHGIALAARALELRSHLRVLFISASPMHPLVIDEVLPAGHPFLPKPFTAGQLVSAVRAALSPLASAR